MAKKSKPLNSEKHQSLRDIAHSTQDASNVSYPQRLMRREMEQGVHKLGDVLDSVMGSQLRIPEPGEGLSEQGVDTLEVALSVIDDSPNLTLTFAQWTVVQGMVEDAVRRGYELGAGRG